MTVRLEAHEEEPATVLGSVRVHERCLVHLARFGRCHLAQGGLQAEVPPEDVGAGPQQRDLHHTPPSGLALFEDGGENPSQAGQAADVIPDAATRVERTPSALVASCTESPVRAQKAPMS